MSTSIRTYVLERIRAANFRKKSPPANGLVHEWNALVDNDDDQFFVVAFILVSVGVFILTIVLINH